jgi:succinoglycan biosynthesis transport protein ExoP
MELKSYIKLLKRWVWLLLLCTILGAGSGYMASQVLKPTYEASTKILVSKDLSDQNSQFAAMNTQQLIDTYVQLLTSASVVDEASRRLNYVIDLENIGSVQQVRSTPVIQITIEDGNPQRAAAIANMLVDVLIDQNTQASGYASTEENIKQSITQVESQISTLQTQFNQISDEKLQAQLKQVNDQITTLQDQVSKVSTEIGPLASLRTLSVEQSAQLADKQAQLAQLQSLLTQYQQIRVNLEYFGKPASNSSNLGDDLRLQLLQSTLDQYQKIYLDLLDNLQTVQLAKVRNTNTIDQIEKATPPTIPVRPRPSVYTVLAGIVGLMFAIGIVFFIEYMDDTLKTPQDIQQALDIPVLGYIANMRPASKAKNGLPAAWQLQSQISETINALRTNLEFAVPQPPLKTLLLLNANESDEGKARIATDLAVSYAQLGNRVILLDADLRNPSVHRYFGLDNENGFSNLLADGLKPESVGKKVEGLAGLTVITGGNASPAPASNGMTIPNRVVKILDGLQKQSDVIIINAPTINIADSWVMASKVDGVLLVIESSGTHLGEARHLMEQLNRARATILGVVLYRIPQNLAYYYESIREVAKEVVRKKPNLHFDPQMENPHENRVVPAAGKKSKKQT